MARNHTFDTNGIEGMLDVILGCTLIFMLMTALVQTGTAGGRETSLPPVDLSTTGPMTSGEDSTRKVTVTASYEDNALKTWIEDEEITAETLQERLAALSNAGPIQVALRRAGDLPCSVEDRLIVACTRAGVRSLSIVVRSSDSP